MVSGLKVLDFPNRDMALVPQRLRDIADEIDKGVYGDVTSAIMVAEASGETVIFGMGPDCTTSFGYLMLGLGQRQLEKKFDL